MFESVRKRFGLTQRKISRCLGMARSTLRYKRKPDDDLLIVSEMKAIIEEHPNYGCQINCAVLSTQKFNRILRNECLNLYYFSDLSSARKIIENWRRDYNVCRPQKGLKGLTPNQYENKLLGRKPNLNSGRI